MSDAPESRRQAICDHCNDDHPDALAAIAVHWVGRAVAEGEAVMVDVDRGGYDLRIAGVGVVRIPFSEPAESSEAVRAELVAHTRRARVALDAADPAGE
jgi:putative heme iron utilization protein